MKFYRDLYVGKNIRKVEQVKRKLKIGAGQFSVYIIALSQSEDQLDIFHCALLRQRFYDRKNLFIVGLASDYAEAVNLAVQITKDTVEQTGEADMKAYIRERM